MLVALGGAGYYLSSGGRWLAGTTPPRFFAFSALYHPPHYAGREASESAQMTSVAGDPFVGREREMAELTAVLDTSTCAS